MPETAIHLAADAYYKPHEQRCEILHLNHLESMFKGIAYVAEYRESEALNHLRRVSNYTCFVAEKVLGLASADARRLGIAALMHDVGKVAIPQELLLKPKSFNLEERQYMQQHTVRGFEIITELEQNFIENKVSFDKRLFEYAKQIARFHHENFDGSGYPEGKAGEDIPIAARVVKIVDVIDALMSRRPYKDPWTWQKVREEAERQANVEFDGILLRKLFEQEKQFLELIASQGVKEK